MKFWSGYVFFVKKLEQDFVPLVIHAFFIKKLFIRKQYSTAQKDRKFQCWISETGQS